MTSFKIIGLALGLAALSACGGSDSAAEANAADANLALEAENLDAGLNAADPALNGAADQNLGADANAAADLNASLPADNAANTSE